MPQYRINYFDVRGLAEVARLILAQAGQEFVDHRFSREQWPEEKTNCKFLKSDSLKASIWYLFYSSVSQPLLHMGSVYIIFFPWTPS